MKPVTTGNKTKRICKKLLPPVFAALFWIAVWEAGALITGKEVLLPSPFSVLRALGKLCVTASFRRSAFASLLRIAAGFFGGALAGTLLAVITAASPFFSALFSPLGTVIRATPVASFIILALVWLDKGSIPSFIAFLMVTPIVWNALKTAIRQTDPGLLEAAAVYRLGKGRTLFAVYIPSVLPQYVSALVTSLGLAWKSGIAAEVLCRPENSVGAELYDAKIMLETPSLFAWTATVILLSVVMEKLFRLAAGKLLGRRNG